MPRAPSLALGALATGVGAALYLRGTASEVSPVERSLRWWASVASDVAESSSRGVLGPSSGSGPTRVFDCKGRLLATVPNAQVALRDMSPWIYRAVVAAEDKTFYDHPGVAWQGLARAAATRGAVGGSTITMQYVKNRYLGPERRLARKAVELPLAMYVDAHLTKEQILEGYLNLIYWGHGAFGIGGAVPLYLGGKSCADVTLSEAAMLASLIPSPETWTPFRSSAADTKRRRNAVLDRMERMGYVGREEAERARAEPVARPSRPVLGGFNRAPHFVDSVFEALPGLLHDAAAARSGAGAGARGGGGGGGGGGGSGSGSGEAQEGDSALSCMMRDGLDIYTTLDLDLQTLAEHEVMKRARENVSMEGAEVALVALSPRDGGVLAMVGGTDHARSGFNRATGAQRSPGSLFKPAVYLAALATGRYNASSGIPDKRMPGVPVENYTRMFSNKMVPLEECLVKSLNVPACRVLVDVGVDRVRELIRDLGVPASVDLPRDVGLALGGFGCTPMDVAAFYNTLAASGEKRPTHLVTEVVARRAWNGMGKGHGETVYRHDLPKRPAKVRDVSRADFRQLHGMLEAVVERGTGRPARLRSGRPVCGKTGTSDNHVDAWFAGYSPDLTCVVWVGRDDGGELEGAGGTLAGPLWGNFMDQAHTWQQLPPRTFRRDREAFDLKAELRKKWERRAYRKARQAKSKEGEQGR